MKTNPIPVMRTMGKQTAKVADLQLWDKNPKDVEAADYERLKRQYELGEHSALLITADGTVLGGNTRLRLYRELKQEDAKVNIIEFVQEKGKTRAIIDGAKAARKFDSEEQAKLEYALSHNGQIGRINREALGELVHLTPIEAGVYEVATYVQSVDDVVHSVSPDPIDNRQEDVGTTDTTGVDTFMNGAIKQIVLYFENEEYLSVLNRLDAIKDTPDENNTSVFLRILKAYEDGNSI